MLGKEDALTQAIFAVLLIGSMASGSQAIAVAEHEREFLAWLLALLSLALYGGAIYAAWLALQQLMVTK